MESNKLNSGVLYSLLLVGLAVLFVLYGRDLFAQFVDLVSDQERVIHFVQGYGLLAPLILAFLQIAQVIVAVIPGFAVSISAGFLFGLPVGILFNHLLTVLASQISYWIARKFGRPVVYKLAPAMIIERWEGAAKTYGFSFFLISFLFPIFPADSINYLGGLSGISGRSFLLASFLGRMPSQVFLSWLGANGASIASLNLSTSDWIFGTLGLVILYYVFVLIARRLTAALKPEE